jgi:mediator of RNA polymerase II transcription subunit 5
MTSSSLEQWKGFLQQCLIRRVDAATFQNLARLLSRRTPLTEISLLDVVLESRDHVKVEWDPLLPLYVDTLTKAGALKIPFVLSGLLKHSSVQPEKPVRAKDSANETGKVTAASEKKTLRASTLMTDTRIIQDMMISISSGHPPKSAKEAGNIFAVIAEWILALIAWHDSQVREDQQSGGLMGSPDAISLFESLGILLAVVSGTQRGLEALSSESPDGQYISTPLLRCFLLPGARRTNKF